MTNSRITRFSLDIKLNRSPRRRGRWSGHLRFLRKRTLRSVRRRRRRNRRFRFARCHRYRHRSRTLGSVLFTSRSGFLGVVFPRVTIQEAETKAHFCFLQIPVFLI
ncbi:hypothetical protein BDW74DRAFT_103666 [Aspergillus multicolor]|uniref:uncharacterized protein n=1 Tax=Aspergillus multicolor TaxID=41759 RepID=UPI003CCCA9E1